MAIRYLLMSVLLSPAAELHPRGARSQAATAIRRVDDLLDRLGEVTRDGEALG